MTSKIRKYFEYSIFLLINIFFSSSGFSALFILGASAYLGNKILYEGNLDPIQNEEWFLFCLIIYLLYMIVKLFFIPAIYQFSKQLPNIHKFLYNFVNNNEKTKQIFILIILFDFVVLIISSIYMSFMNVKEINNWSDIIYLLGDSINGIVVNSITSILFLGGIFINYVIFYFGYKLILKNRKCKR
jgi:hypothetical protein